MKYIVQIPLNLEIDVPENMDREAIEQAIEDDLIVFIAPHSVLRSISPLLQLLSRPRSLRWKEEGN